MLAELCKYKLSESEQPSKRARERERERQRERESDCPAGKVPFTRNGWTRKRTDV